MSGDIDWTLCIICQKKTSEELRCPSHDPLDVYDSFVHNVEEFRKNNSLPVKIRFESAGGKQLMEKQAKWHKKCHQKFNNAKLKRSKLKRQRESTDGVTCHPKRRVTDRNIRLCIFCEVDSSEPLHEFSTLSASNSITQMATEMGDSTLLVKIGGIDLPALEAKYHFGCLTKYRNHYRAHLRSMASSSNSLGSVEKKAKARAFAELVEYIDTSLEEGMQTFQLAELHAIYQERLQEFDVSCTINKTRLKDDILNHFLDYNIQAQSTGNKTVFIFPEGMKEMLQHIDSYHSEAIQVASIAKKIRQEIFEHEGFKFSGNFPHDSQKDCVPYNLKLLLSMILYGPTLNSERNVNTQACLTAAQIVLFNMKKGSAAVNNKNRRHSVDREPPLPVYIGLNIHSTFRSKKLVDQLNELCVSISYDRVLQLENCMAMSMCQQFQSDGIVCPSNLNKGLFVTGALDNIDHNPTSTTAQSSFHGTGISITQFPLNGNAGICRQLSPFVDGLTSETPQLPLSYSTVPSVALNSLSTSVPERNCQMVTGTLCRAKVREEGWLQNVIKLLGEQLDDYQPLSWSAYHAHLQPCMIDPPVVTALLPLFFEKADTPAMIKHGMNIIKSITEFLHPEQLPVMTCDCPIFAKAKYIQWMWPTEYGEDVFVVMFGGLHIEMGLWKMLGDYLAKSGWTAALTEAGVCSSGTAESFLTASHLAKTRHAHQVSVAALATLQHQAFLHAREDENLEEWRAKMSQMSPTFKFWDSIKELEQLILIFVRAHREKNFDLYIEVLEALVGYFFALDHYNYARWIPIHIRDMKSLPSTFKEKFKSHWVASKTNRRFSCMPLDQVHEQENARVKGKGGIIGLTESQVALQQWMVCGPEVAKCLCEFESRELHCDDETPVTSHHEEGLATQVKMKEQVQNLIETMITFGNPFEDECPELLVLNTRVCMNESVVDTVRSVEALGNRCKPKSKSSQKLVAERHNASLFSRLYIASQQRSGDLATFFSHENQSTPPSLSDCGKLRVSQKSTLLNCFDTKNQPSRPCLFDAKILDGSAVVHFLPTASAKTFNEYADKVFLPFILEQLKSTRRLDCVWDRYITSSIKELTRIRRGSGLRMKVSGNTKLPKKWNDFLLDAKNKQELFDFLTAKVCAMDIPEGTRVSITSGNSVNCKGTQQQMAQCDHEEADTRIMIHVQDVLENGGNVVMVRTVDTDVLVLLVGMFHHFQEKNPSAEIWVAFGTGKRYCYYHVNTICENLGKDKSTSLPPFHAFTGCDTTSSFFGRSKKSAWLAWNACPEVTEAFLFIAANPYSPIHPSFPQFSILERFTVVLYHKTSSLSSVNDARRELFCRKNKGIENIPPTQDALFQHVKRCIFQSGVWTTCLSNMQNVPSPENWGWKKEDSSLHPIWMTLPEAARACHELIKCGCKSKRGCSTQCSCLKAGFCCTDLCDCACEVTL